MLLRVLERVNSELESYETEEIVAAVPAGNNKDNYMFSVMTQHYEKPQFSIWLWNDKEGTLDFVISCTEVDLAAYTWMKQTDFIHTMHKAALENKFKEIYGFIEHEREEYILVCDENKREDSNLISRLAIKKSDIPDENGYIELKEVVIKDDKVHEIKPALTVTEAAVRKMYVMNGEMFSSYDDKGRDVILRFITPPPFDVIDK